MFRSTRLLTLLAGTTLAVSVFTGTAGAAGPVGPDEITNNPCAGNPDLPACQGGDDPEPGIDLPDLDWCFSLDVEDCASEEPEPTEPTEPTEPNPDDDIPSADPADAVTSSPNFTG